MKLNDFFQKGYYINLDRRTDRREEFEAEVKKAGLENLFERFPAIDGMNASDKDWGKHKYCALSYKKLFEKIYDEGHEYFLIFEDDAEFYNHTDITGLELAELALDELQNFPDWDMIYFGGYPFDLMELVSPHLAKCNNILTTHAIGYKRRFLEIILNQTSNFNPETNTFPIDGWLGSQINITKYIVNPISIIQRHSVSDLDAFGHKANARDFLNRYDLTKKIKKY